MHLLGRADPLDQATLPDNVHLVSISATDSESELGNHGVPSRTELVSDHQGQDFDRPTQGCISEHGTCGVPSQLKATAGGLGGLDSRLITRDPVANLDHDDYPGAEHGTSSGVPSQPVEQVNDQTLNSEHGMSVPSQSKSTLGHSLGQNTGPAVGDSAARLNPSAVPFVARNRILDGFGHDNEDDLHQVLQVQAGGVGRLDHGGHELWDAEVVSGSRPTQNSKVEQHITMQLPFSEVEDISDVLSIAPKDIHKVGVLPDMRITLPVG